MLWVKRNPSIEELYRDAEQKQSIKTINNGAMVAYSGENTGRSPRDKRVVYDENTKDIWWGDINIPIRPDLFTHYRDFAKKYLDTVNRYEVDVYAGWDLENRIKIRVVCTSPYHALFVRNMFIPTDEVFEKPDFVIYNVCKLKLSNVTEKLEEDVEKDVELRDKLVALNFTTMEMVIYGTEYAGEMKKGVLTLLMYLMQNKGHLTLHSGAGKTNKGVCMFFGLSGTGKCHGINTPIMMYNGTIKLVQDVIIGDIIMGNDSTPRKVLNLGRGEDEMYEITNVKGDTYTVNSEHILCLKHNRTPYIKDRTDRKSFILQWFNTTKYKTDTITMSYKRKDKEKVFEELKNVLQEKLKLSKYFTISVKDYLKTHKGYLKNFCGYTTGVEFEEKEVDLDPYLLGLWLGDGTSRTVEITNQDAVILKYLSKNLSKYDCYLSHKAQYTYRFNSLRKNNINLIANKLRKYNLLNNKHIPYEYKCNSRENRLKLLAGLIDSDGFYCKKGKYYEITQKNMQLSDDIQYLARSLGFMCSNRKCQKSCMYKGDKKTGIYNRLGIVGNTLMEIPVLCHRKKASSRQQVKNPLCSQIQIKSIGVDKYYGFELDGNHKYVLGNFIVTHNTTLSSQTRLIGDDEHVWTGKGIFNVEGGCYAKCIGLSRKHEPEIYDSIKYGAVLENVVLNEAGEPDYKDNSITMNTRCAYPLRHLENIVTPSVGDHPKNIIFLTCDGTGLLPPIAKLGREDAIKYFLLGYTSKMPGTEMGIDQPTSIFSPCFGEPFLVWQPMRYAELLREKIKEHSPNVWLLNTGWYKGGYGEGERMPLKITRRIVDLIMSEKILTREFEIFPNLNLEVPKKLDDDIGEDILFPNKNWSDEGEYWKRLGDLIKLFDEKYRKIINL